MKVILISGRAENGKSELGKYLKGKLEDQGKKVIVDRFAKYIKQYAVQLGWDGVTKDEYWRNFLQTTGTELIQQKLNMKTFHPKRLAEDIEILNQFGVDYFIIDDTRFRREIDYIKSVFPNDTMTVRVHRVDHISKLTEEQLNHISENDLNGYKFDYNIFVQSGIEHLHDETDRVFKGVLY
jgi:hypothetical protein